MVYRGTSRQNSSPLDALNRLTFIPATHATKRPTCRDVNSNIVILSEQDTRQGGDTMVKDQQHGRPIGTSSHGPQTRSQQQQPKELFPRDDVCLEWRKLRRVGSGLANLGNTCFMNSVLQCLIHTAPLAELLLSNKKTLAYKKAEHGELDPIGMTQALVRESLEGKREYVSPVQHAKSLKRINRWFRLGRQEDAHEYLIALLDAMHDRSIAGIHPKPSREIEYTSFIYQIFGGKIRSQLKCTQCDYESNTYDPFLDLSLEITRAHSVQKALQRFTAGEVLDGQNSYKCPKQNKLVRAVKRMTIEDIPNILIIQLKRFEFSRSGRKISKHVDFDQTLDLSPFMSHIQKKGSAMYELYGVLVHQGYSMHSGHYYCFLKGMGGGEWHKFDDTRVHATSARNAMGQSPYILFYTRKQTPAARPGKENVPTSDGEERLKTKKMKKEATPDPIPRHTPNRVEKENHIDRSKEKKSKSPKMNKRPITRPISLTPLARSKFAQGGAILLPRTRLRSSMQKQQIPQTPRSGGNSSMAKKRSASIDDASFKMEKRNRKKKKVVIPTPSLEPKRDTEQSSPSRSKKRGSKALEKYKTHTVGMGLDNWDDIDTDTKKQRDRNIRKTIVPRKQPDEYDADYDKGRTKKVKSTTASAKHLTSAAYDAVAKQLSKAKRLFAKS